MLSLWWAGHPRAFIRAPCSGGWPHARAEGDMVANVNDRKVPSLIKTSALEFCRLWSMDVKRRIKGSSKKPWTFEELLTAKKHPILKWWEEINELADTRETMRFLVINKASRHSYVMFGEQEMQHLKERCSTWPIARSITFDCYPEVRELLTVFELRLFLSGVDARELGGLGSGPEEAGGGAQTAPEDPAEG